MKLIHYLIVLFGIKNQSGKFIKVQTTDFDGCERIRIAKRLKHNSIRVRGIYRHFIGSRKGTFGPRCYITSWRKID